MTDMKEALVNAKLATSKEVSLTEEIEMVSAKIDKLKQKGWSDNNKEIIRLKRVRDFAEAKLQAIKANRRKVNSIG